MKNHFILVIICSFSVLVSCAPFTVNNAKGSAIEPHSQLPSYHGSKVSTVQSHSQLPPYQGSKANVVVAEFECKAARCDYQIGRGMADALISSLVMSKPF